MSYIKIFAGLFASLVGFVILAAPHVILAAQHDVNTHHILRWAIIGVILGLGGTAALFHELGKDDGRRGK